MKRIGSISIIIMTFFSLLSCINHGKENVLLMDLGVPQENHPSITELFTPDYDIIQLETDSSCLIGEINKIKKLNNKYYISSSGKSIFGFDSIGRCFLSLGKMGQGPEEYLRIEDFDVYNVEGNAEVWISDNKSLKIYDALNGDFLRKIDFPFIIHKFKRIENSHLLLVTGQSEKSLTLTDKDGKVLKDFLKKEIPFLMFRSVQFVPKGKELLYQLGISNAFVSFNPQTEEFTTGTFTDNKKYLSSVEMLDLFGKYHEDFIREANQGSYIGNILFLGDTVWIETCISGRNFITKYANGKMLSTEFSFGTILSTIVLGDSENSILMYATPEELLYDDAIKLLLKADMNIKMEDNPCIIEFK